MPIGFDSGDLGGGGTRLPPGRRPSPARRGAPAVRADESDLDDMPSVLDEIGRGLWSWVAVLTRAVEPVPWTRWAVAADERTCPECAPLDGLAWRDGTGPAPPLHPNCRCARLPAITEWRTRPATRWELRWSPT